MPVPAEIGRALGNHDQMGRAGTDHLMTARAAVRPVPGHLSNGDPLRLSPRRSQPGRGTRRVGRGPFSSGSVSSWHAAIILVRPMSSDLEEFHIRGEGRFPGFLGIEVVDVGHGRTHMRLDIASHHVAPNGFLHAGVVVGLADSACGYGCVASLPDGAQNFATIEVKTNFLGTVTEGSIECRSSLVHGGRTTQVWDAEVTDEATGKVLALFRCTQLIVYPR